MRVLFVNTNDYMGGAARAAFRLSSELRRKGLEVGFFGQNAFLRLREEQIYFPRTKVQRAVGQLRPSISKLPRSRYRSAPPSPFSTTWLPSFGRFRRAVESFKPDLVHLHWVGDGLGTMAELLQSGRPTLWTLHDSWGMTGGCHIPRECVRYLEGCGQCPQLGSRWASDLSGAEFRRKRRAFRDANLTIVAPSRWLFAKSRESALLRRFPHCHIPNGLDPATFRPLPTELCRRQLGLPLDKKVILFGAMEAESDINKGFDLLKAALEARPEEHRRSSVLAVFGGRRMGHRRWLGYDLYDLGPFHDETSLPLLYGAADVTVVPSRSENFPNTALESLFCGTPVVAFRVGGLVDLLDETALASPESPGELAGKLQLVLEKDHDREGIHERARARYSLHDIAREYISLYQAVSGGVAP